MSINTDNLIPVRCARMGGQVDWDDPVQIPNGLAILSQNMQFLAESVKVRWGLQVTSEDSAVNGNPTGVDVLTVLGDASSPSVQQAAGGGSRSQSAIARRGPFRPPVDDFKPLNITPNTQVGIVFTDQGELFLELPAGTGNLVEIPSTGEGARIAASIVGILPTGSVMQTSKAFNRIYEAFSNLVVSTGPVLALDAATGFESPVGQNPIAAVWLPNTFYQQGDIVTSSTNPAVWWRRLNTGYSGPTEPTWPMGIAALGYFSGDAYTAPTYAEASDALGQEPPLDITGTAQTGPFVVTIFFSGSPPIANGQQFILSGLNYANWLNRTLLTVTGSGPGFFQAAYNHSVYTETSDTGNATLTGTTIQWQEWTMAIPSFLPTPNPIASITDTPGGGTIPAGKDVYVCLSYFNDLGESLWTQPFVFRNTGANDQLQCTFGTANPASGPPMPSWLMSVMGVGTTAAGLHWPAPTCINVYAAAVAHGASAPTEYGLYGQVMANSSIGISSVPGSATLTPPIAATAAISTEQFMGEGGVRQAILLRQNTMGDLSAVDPQCAIGVPFNGALSVPCQINVGAFQPPAGTTIPATYATLQQYGESTSTPPTITNGTSYYAQLAEVKGGEEVAWSPVLGPFTVTWLPGAVPDWLYTFEAVLPGDGEQDSWSIYIGTSPTALNAKISGIANNVTSYVVTSPGTSSNASNATLYMYVLVDDVTPFTPGQEITITNPAVPAWNGKYLIQSVAANQQVGWLGNSFVSSPAPYPGGTLVIYSATGWPSNSEVQAGTVSIPAGPCPVAVVPPGVGEGPGYSYDIVAFTTVGLSANGPFNYLATADPANPFSTSVTSETTDGDGNGTALIGSAIALTPGETVLIAGWTGGNAALNGQRVIATIGLQSNCVTFPDDFAAGTYAATGITMSVVQTEPTLAVPGTVGILMQFDDTTLPEGVDVTGNLLFIAVPPCIDLAYLPSLQRMSYVSDQQPTSLIFSEIGFMGEVDGLNDVLAVEQSNGSRVVGARELLNGMIVACKESGGYQVVPTADVPANWGLNRLWGEHGPWSGRNIATTLDGLVPDFLIFVDPDTGVYKYPPTLGMGELDWLSKELSGANNQDASRMATWDRVNRAAGQQIQVVVDTTAKEIKVAVPLDGATTPNYILTMSYFNGWQDPLLMTLNGDWVPSRQARRWNLDPIPTRAMALVKRTLQTPVDQRVNYRQLVIGQWSATPPPVALLYMEPGVYNDLGAAIVPRYRLAYAREIPNQKYPPGGRVLRFSACTGHAIGSGKMSITAFMDDPTYEAEPKLVPLNTGPPQIPGSASVTHFNKSLKGDSEFLTVEFSTDEEPGSWFQLLEVTNLYTPLFPTR